MIIFKFPLNGNLVMAVNYGQEIRKILKLRGMTVAEFARRINKSRENAYDIFRRKSLDIDLLNTISQALEYDFILTTNQTSKVRNHSRSEFAFEAAQTYRKSDVEIVMLREEMHLLRKEMGDLRERISKIEKRSGKK
jgi:transcriptional regulator with XRE-family HTH domain